MPHPHHPSEDQRLVGEVIPHGPHPRDLSHEGRQVHTCLDRLERSIDTVSARYVETIAAVAEFFGTIGR